MCHRRPGICILCENLNPFISSFMNYQQMFDKGNMADVISRTDTTCPFGGRQFPLVFLGVRVIHFVQLLVFIFVLCPQQDLLTLSYHFITDSMNCTSDGNQCKADCNAVDDHEAGDCCGNQKCCCTGIEFEYIFSFLIRILKQRCNCQDINIKNNINMLI